MKNKRTIWGIFLLLVPVLLLANEFEILNIGVLRALICCLLAVLFAIGIFERNFFLMLLPLAGLYLVLQNPLKLKAVGAAPMLLSAVIAAWGLNLIFQDRWRFGKHRSRSAFHSHRQTAGFEGLDEKYPRASTSFGSMSKYIHSSSLEGGTFSVSFGNLELYFKDAQLSPQGAVVNLDCSFGNIALYIPKTWRVEDKLTLTLGNVEIHGKSDYDSQEGPALTLVGSVRLGNVEVNRI